MAPHRAHGLLGAVGGNLRSLAQMPVDTTGAVVTAVGAAAAWAIGATNVGLLLIVGCAMVLDLIVGALRAVDDPLQEFDAAKLYGGFVGKIFRMFLIPTVALVDRLVVMSGFVDSIEGVFPLTKAVLFGLAAAELTSVLNKFRDGGVAPQLIAEVVRHLDRIRAGQEPPLRRHYDPAAIASQIEREVAKDTDTNQQGD